MGYAQAINGEESLETGNAGLRGGGMAVTVGYELQGVAYRLSGRAGG